MWGLLWVFILDFPFHLLVEFFQLGVVFEDGQVEVEFSEGRARPIEFAILLLVYLGFFP